jgi:hypothetical protein
LDELLSGDLQSVCTTLRALASWQMDQGRPAPVVGGNPGLSAKAVLQIGKRFEQERLEQALFDAAPPGKAPALDSARSSRLLP